MKKIKATRGMRIAAFGDIHGIYKDPAAVALACKLINVFNPHVSVNLGDGADMEAISGFGKSLEQLKSLQPDITSFIEAQEQLNAAAPNNDKFYCRGNHCQRLEKLFDSITGLSTLDALTLPKILELDKMNVSLVDSLLVGQGSNVVEFVHGFYIRKAGGSSIRAMMEGRGFEHHMCMGHSHRAAYYNYSTASRVVWGIEAGSLCSAEKMRYAANKSMDWQTGICFITFQGKPLRPIPELIVFDVQGKYARATWRGQEYNVNR